MELQSLLSEISPYFGVSGKTAWPELQKGLEIRQALGRACGFEGDFYKKLDLNDILPGVRSYAAFAFPYPVLIPKLENLTLSSYTCIDDYHRVVLSRLKTGVEALKALYPGHEFLPLTDSGKAFEKEAALCAGLGFRGRNSLVIHPLLGSYFFIGLILSTALMSKNSSHTLSASGCGECRRCIQVCPAGALDELGLNAAKCVSYLTQKKGEAEKPKNWRQSFWGCDLCQMVCPHNLHRSVRTGEGFSFKFDLKILKTPTLSPAEFKKAAAPLALKWGGQKILIRNFQVL